MSGLRFRPYTKVSGITEDYLKVRDFLKKRGYCEFTYARWDWMATHSYLKKDSLDRQGLWMDEKGDVGAAVLFDCQPGKTYLLTLPGYEDLRSDLITYAQQTFSEEERYGLVIPDQDRDYQNAAAQAGYCATPDREYDAAFFVGETSYRYTLPAGFSLTDLQEHYDLYQYGRVLWKGFNHERDGEGPFRPTAEELSAAEKEMKAPYVDLHLKIAAVSPEGNFAAYCGMWYDPAAGYAVIEPVATDPDYRRLGLGRAVVLEGIRRSAELGAKLALVGSSQTFYYRIGLRPYASSSIWRK